MPEARGDPYHRPAFEADREARDAPAAASTAPAAQAVESRGWGQRLVDDLLLPSRISDGDFGGWLRDAMAEQRISRGTLAMRTGLDRSTISRLLTNGRSPSFDTAIAIIKILRPRPGGR